MKSGLTIFSEPGQKIFAVTMLIAIPLILFRTYFTNEIQLIAGVLMLVIYYLWWLKKNMVLQSGSSVQLHVVGRTMALAGIGIALGALGSFLGTRLIGSLLYGVNPTDPVTFLAMATILLSVSALAGYLPARRASRTDPTTAFRSA